MSRLSAFELVRRLPAPIACAALLLLAVVCMCAFPHVASAAPTVGGPTISINTSASKEMTNAEVYSGLKLAILLSALVFLPSIIMTATSFTRIAIVLAVTRQAIGTAQTPPNQVIMGLALFLTIGIMNPVFTDIYSNALIPYSEDQIGHGEAMTRAFAPLRTFMLRHTREQDLALFQDVTKSAPVDSPEELNAAVVIPAFVISELNTAFQIAFLIYLPFVILDMIISSVLTSMSMITLPPTVISLPIKLMLFVVIDGWGLIIGNLVRSYHVS